MHPGAYVSDYHYQEAHKEMVGVGLHYQFIWDIDLTLNRLLKSDLPARQHPDMKIVAETPPPSLTLKEGG